MPPTIAELWANAFGRLEEESKKVFDNLRRNMQRARDRADAERMLREAYERMERSLSLFPTAKEIDQLAQRIERLSDRIAELEEQNGIESSKKSAGKKKTTKKTRKKKSKSTSKSKPKSKSKSSSKSKSKSKSSKKS